MTTEEAQMEAVAEWINNRLRKPPTVDKIAREFCMSTSTLKNRFRARFGQGIKEYYQTRRIRFAAAKLAQGCSVKSVQMEFGYKSPSAFDKAFIKVHKMGPGTYAKMHRYT